MIKRLISHRFISFFLLLILPLTLAGCWNRKEVQDISIGTAIGIDRIIVEGKPQYLVSIYSLNPGKSETSAPASGQPQKSSPGIVLSMQGDTIYDAVRNFALRDPRQLFLSHALVLIIGEETAAGGIDQIIEFSTRHRDIRLRTYVVVCEGLARDALQAHTEIESMISVELSKMIERNRDRVDKTVDSDLLKVTKTLLTPGSEVLVSNMKLFLPPETSSLLGEGSVQQGDGGGNSGTAAAQKKSFTLSGAAAFRGDRMIGRINEEEAQGLLLITGQAEGGIIPFAAGASEPNASVLYRDLSSDIKALVKEDGSLAFEVRIEGLVELLEQNNAAIDINGQGLKEAQKLANQEVERRCRAAVDRAQGLETDILGLGYRLHRSNPKAWKVVKDRWAEVFPTVQVTIKSELEIEHVGLVSRPYLAQ